MFVMEGAYHHPYKANYHHPAVMMGDLKMQAEHKVLTSNTLKATCHYLSHILRGHCGVTHLPSGPGGAMHCLHLTTRLL